MGGSRSQSSHRRGLLWRFRRHGGRSADDSEIVEALRYGDDEAFRRLMDEHGSAMLRVAMSYVGSRAAAEEVLQETWIGVLRGIDRFEGRSSLRTWIFRILTNTAKTRAARESRSVPFSSLGVSEGSDEARAVEPDRFLRPDQAGEGRWASPPRRWTPEDDLLAVETRKVILDTIAMLPPMQRAVVTLRDIEGWPADEVCDALELTDGNQRVLLHRARSKVRADLERYLGM